METFTIVLFFTGILIGIGIAFGIDVYANKHNWGTYGQHTKMKKKLFESGELKYADDGSGRIEWKSGLKF